MGILTAILLLIYVCSSIGFNLDTKLPMLFQGPERSYFGYTVALHRNRFGPVVLVGAPKANSTTLRASIYEPGGLFNCSLSSKELEKECEEIAVMKDGNIRIDNGDLLSYAHKKDKMWLGVSLDVQENSTSNQNDIVVCGHLWKNQRYIRELYVNGICYVINSDMGPGSVRILLPLIRKDKQLVKHITGVKEYPYGYGQAGISALFAENGDGLTLGAPGYMSWKGSLINYRVNRKAGGYSNPTIVVSQSESYNSYFGYSFSTGKFLGKEKHLFAVSAPRDADNHGTVYIVRIKNNKMKVLLKKNGEQLGEYFGACVLGIDINRDGRTDLLVGAPLHSMDGNGNVGDEGIVYVYRSNGENLEKIMELSGENKVNARFGTSIASIGDINQDKYLDIAIGAPYEDKNGAIYIYHGSFLGLKSRYAQLTSVVGYMDQAAERSGILWHGRLEQVVSVQRNSEGCILEQKQQRIAASTLNSNLFGFGIHISRGLDIDDNGYPDIAVGSYASSNAVLLRSRPIISVYSRLEFISNKIDRNLTCEVNGSNRTCFQVDACLQYTGEHVPTSLEFMWDLRLKDQSNRAFFVQSLNQGALNKSGVLLNVQKCSRYQMFLRRNIEDLITPIQVQFSHTLAPPDDLNYFNIPIYNPSSQKSITSNVYFETGCSQELACFSDLIVSAELKDTPNTGVLILGTMPSISVSVAVRNRGDPAYMAKLFIYLPKDMPVINSDICENEDQYLNASLACNLGNPLASNTLVKINIKLDATKIQPHTKYLKITLLALSSSNETRPGDNLYVLPLHLKTVSSISVIGTSSTEQVMYDETDSTPKIITHTYIVRNHGPSPLKTINFSLLVPNVLHTDNGPVPILSFTGLETDRRSLPAVSAACNRESLEIQAVPGSKNHKSKSSIDVIPTEDDENTSELQSLSHVIVPPSNMKESSLNSVDIPMKEESNESEITKDSEESKIQRIMISCGMENVKCIEVLCSASPFSKDKKFAEISVSFQMNFSNLDSYLGPWFHIEVATKASISAPDTEADPQRENIKVAQLTTVLLNKSVPPAEPPPMWIIFVSVGIGILLLLFLLVIFVKIGFFRRKEKDKMKRLLSEKENKENNENNENVYMVEDDTEDLNS